MLYNQLELDVSMTSIKGSTAFNYGDRYGNFGTSGRRSSGPAFGLSTGHYKRHLFPIFSPSRPFLIEGVLGSKNLYSESCLERPKTSG